MEAVVKLQVMFIRLATQVMSTVVILRARIIV